MSWRRFNVLVRGLSPNSALVTKSLANIQFGKRRVDQDVVTVEGAKAADQAFNALFRPAERVS